MASTLASVLSSFFAVSVRPLASVALSCSVDFSEAEPSESALVKPETLSTTPRTLSGSTATTSLSTSSESFCSRSASGPILREISASEPMAPPRPEFGSPSAFENRLTF